MPAALNVDREAARVLCVAVGVREAARQMNIPEATMQAWSARGKWTQAIQEARATSAKRIENRSETLQPNATKPAEALVNVLADESKKTRLKLSRAAYKAAKTFAKRPGDAIIADSQALRHVTAVAATVHGWEEGKPASLNLQLGVFVGGIQ